MTVTCEDGKYTVTHIAGEELVSDKLYSMACYTYDLNKCPAFIAYAKAFPQRIPSAEASRPVITLLVQFFCNILWTALVDADGDGTVSMNEVLDFIAEQDEDKTGSLSFDELSAAIQKKLGNSSKVVAEQMMALLDADRSGEIDLEEARALISQK
jgi:hypothetical protein